MNNHKVRCNMLAIIRYFYVAIFGRNGEPLDRVHKV